MLTKFVHILVNTVLSPDSVVHQIQMRIRKMHKIITTLSQIVQKHAIFLIIEIAENQMETQAAHNLINTVLNSDSVIH